MTRLFLRRGRLLRSGLGRRLGSKMLFFRRLLDILSLQQFIGSTLKVFVFRVGIIVLFV